MQIYIKVVKYLRTFDLLASTVKNIAMKSFYGSLWVIIFLSFSQITFSQFISLDIPAALEIDPGNNWTVNQNDIVILGGSPTASNGIPPYEYNWTPTTGLDDPSSANPAATIEDTITYTLEVIDGNGCSATSQITISCIFSGIEEEINSKLRIYPNPNTGIININFTELFGEMSISIFDMNGKLVKSKQICVEKTSIHSLDIQEFLQGNYLLEIEGNEFTYKRSIIKL